MMKEGWVIRDDNAVLRMNRERDGTERSDNMHPIAHLLIAASSSSLWRSAATSGGGATGRVSRRRLKTRRATLEFEASDYSVIKQSMTELVWVIAVFKKKNIVTLTQCPPPSMNQG